RELHGRVAVRQIGEHEEGFVHVLDFGPRVEGRVLKSRTVQAAGWLECDFSPKPALPLMPHQVTIQASGHTFTVNDGESVLDAALREGIIIAYGCRNGACATCKGRLISGKLDYGTYEEHALPDAEREAGMALFCQ